MEKRILGIMLSLLGVVGLIYAGISFMNGGTGGKSGDTDHLSPVEADHLNPEQTDHLNPVQIDHPLSCI